MSIDLKYGVPTVCLHTSMFVTVTRSVVRMNGAPRMRQVYLPHPVMGKTAEQIEGYVYGESPISGKSVMQEVVEGLTQPLNDEDRKGLTFTRSTPRLCEPASEAELNRLFVDNNWTDKLPIVLPTVERVAEMMRHHYCPVNTRIDSVGCAARRGSFCSRCRQTLAARAFSRTG